MVFGLGKRRERSAPVERSTVVTKGNIEGREATRRIGVGVARTSRGNTALSSFGLNMDMVTLKNGV